MKRRTSLLYTLPLAGLVLGLSGMMNSAGAMKQAPWSCSKDPSSTATSCVINCSCPTSSQPPQQYTVSSSPSAPCSSSVDTAEDLLDLGVGNPYACPAVPMQMGPPKLMSRDSVITALSSWCSCPRVSSARASLAKRRRLGLAQYRST
jgi:hypothetical protein